MPRGQKGRPALAAPQDNAGNMTVAVGRAAGSCSLCTMVRWGELLEQLISTAEKPEPSANGTAVPTQTCTHGLHTHLGDVLPWQAAGPAAGAASSAGSPPAP